MIGVHIWGVLLLFTGVGVARDVGVLSFREGLDLRD